MVQPFDLRPHLGEDVEVVRRALESDRASVVSQALTVPGPLGLLYYAQASSPLLPAAYPGFLIQLVAVGSRVVGFIIDGADRMTTPPGGLSTTESP